MSRTYQEQLDWEREKKMQKTFDLAKARSTDSIESHKASDRMNAGNGKLLKASERAVLQALSENNVITAKRLGEIMSEGDVRRYEWPHKRMAGLVAKDLVLRIPGTINSTEKVCFITDKGLEILGANNV